MNGAERNTILNWKELSLADIIGIEGMPTIKCIALSQRLTSVMGARP